MKTTKSVALRQLSEYPPAMPKLVDEIRKAVEQADESRYSIAAGSGVNAGILSRLVTGKRSSLSVETCERLADYLGLEIVVRPRRSRKGARR